MHGVHERIQLGTVDILHCAVSTVYIAHLRDGRVHISCIQRRLATVHLIHRRSMQLCLLVVNVVEDESQSHATIVGGRAQHGQRVLPNIMLRMAVHTRHTQRNAYLGRYVVEHETLTQVER